MTRSTLRAQTSAPNSFAQVLEIARVAHEAKAQAEYETRMHRQQTFMAELASVMEQERRRRRTRV